MSKEFLDPSAFTDSASGIDLFSNSIRKGLQYDALGGPEFIAKVLTPPAKLSLAQAVSLSPSNTSGPPGETSLWAGGWSALKAFFTSDKEKERRAERARVKNLLIESKFSYTGRIEEIHGAFLGDPSCALDLGGNPISDPYLLHMHTKFISAGVLGEVDLPNVGDLVRVRLSKGDNGYDLQHGTHIEIYASMQPFESAMENPACQSLSDLFGGDITGVLNTPAGGPAAGLCPDEGADQSRIQELADAIGVELPVLLAVRSVESGGEDSAIRFEAHRFHRYVTPDGGGIPYSPGPGSEVVDYTPDHSNATAFSRGYAVNRAAAIKSTSWGTYQVMGDWAPYALDSRISNALKSDADAQTFIDYFNADPVAVSDEMLVGWMKGNPSAIEHAANKDWTGFATVYNGSLCCTPGSHQYDKKLQERYSQSLKCPGVSPDEVS